MQVQLKVVHKTITESKIEQCTKEIVRWNLCLGSIDCVVKRL